MFPTVSNTASQVPAASATASKAMHRGQPSVTSHNLSASNSGSQFTYENFHLDPQDYQNFLLINPPLTEYSNHYYMNLNKSANATNVNPENVQPTQTAPVNPIVNPIVNPVVNSFSVSSDPATIVENEILGQITLNSEVSPGIGNNEQILNPNIGFNGFETTRNNTTLAGVVGNIQTNNSTSQYLDVHGFNELGNVANVGNMSAQQTHNQSQRNNQGFFFDEFNFDNQNNPLPSRRLSISNGQIGQISMMVHSQMQNHNHNHSSSGETPNSSESTTIAHSSGGVFDNSVAGNGGSGGGGQFDVDSNGVPVRQLIYNNEVIFNPSGPIPGTNAFKRAKILERNRIAASKCRAKKKNMQKKLQEDVDELVNEKVKLNEMLVALRSRVLRYCKIHKINPNDVIGDEMSDVKIEDVDESQRLYEKMEAERRKAEAEAEAEAEARARARAKAEAEAAAAAAAAAEEEKARNARAGSLNQSTSPVNDSEVSKRLEEFMKNGVL